MKKRLNPWFVFGLSVCALWAGWVLWVQAFSTYVPYGGHWPEFEYEPPVWAMVLLALFPGAWLFYSVPRQIEDNGKRWWQPAVLSEIVVSWATNIIQVIVFLIVAGLLVNIGTSFFTFYNSPSEYVGPEWLYEFLAKCDTLEAELAIDYQCLDNDECKMSRGELNSFNERVAKHGLYCDR